MGTSWYIVKVHKEFETVSFSEHSKLVPRLGGLCVPVYKARLYSGLLTAALVPGLHPGSPFSTATGLLLLLQSHPLQACLLLVYLQCIVMFFPGFVRRL